MENFEIIEDFCKKNNWIDFLAESETYRSKTSVCLKFIDPWFLSLKETKKIENVDKFLNILESNNAAYDIKHYRTAPIG